MPIFLVVVNIDVDAALHFCIIHVFLYVTIAVIRAATKFEF